MSNFDDDHEEESFFVSMTDIMVGLLFIFILIIMYFAIQAKIDQQTIEEQKKEIGQLKILIPEDGISYSILTNYQRRIADQQKNLLRWIKAHLENNGIEGVQLVEEQGVIRLPEGVLFDSGEFQFEDGSAAEETARSIARALESILECSVLKKNGQPFKFLDECKDNFYHNKNVGFVQAIYVEGHTDSIPIQSALRDDPNITSNLKLSARRSTNTFETMTDESPVLLKFHGPIPGEMDLRFEPVLASSSYGEWRPVASNKTKEGRRSNRRIDLRLVMYVPPNIGAMKQLADLVGGASKTGLYGE